MLTLKQWKPVFLCIQRMCTQHQLGNRYPVSPLQACMEKGDRSQVVITQEQQKKIDKGFPQRTSQKNLFFYPPSLARFCPHVAYPNPMYRGVYPP